MDSVFHLSEFKTLRRLGSGKFGKVVLVQSDVDRGLPSQLYAVKVVTHLNKSILNLSNVDNITKVKNEIKLINSVNQFNHPNILKLYSIIKNDTVSKLYFVMEYCQKGELSSTNLINFPTSNKLQNLQSKLKQIVQGLEFLHSQNIIHRDIKPSNLLLTESGILKISDFGTCYRLTDDDKIDQFEIYKTITGTPLFIAPEVCSTQAPNKQKDYFKVDLWSLGITLFYLFFRSYPYYNENEFKLFNDIKTTDANIPKIITDCFLLMEVKDKKNLQSDYNLDFVAYYKSLTTVIKKLLIRDPSDRMSMKNLKASKIFKLFTSSEDYSKFIHFNDSYKSNQLTKKHKFSSKVKQNNTNKLLRVSKSEDLLTNHVDMGNLSASSSSASPLGKSRRLNGAFNKLFNLSHNSPDSSFTATSVNSSDTDFNNDQELLGGLFINDSSISLPMQAPNSKALNGSIVTLPSKLDSELGNVTMGEYSKLRRNNNYRINKNNNDDDDDDDDEVLDFFGSGGLTGGITGAVLYDDSFDSSSSKLDLSHIPSKERVNPAPLMTNPIQNNSSSSLSSSKLKQSKRINFKDYMAVTTTTTTAAASSSSSSESNSTEMKKSATLLEKSKSIKENNYTKFGYVYQKSANNPNKSTSTSSTTTPSGVKNPRAMISMDQYLDSLS